MFNTMLQGLYCHRDLPANAPGMAVPIVPEHCQSSYTPAMHANAQEPTHYSYSLASSFYGNRSPAMTSSSVELVMERYTVHAIPIVDTKGCVEYQ